MKTHMFTLSCDICGGSGVGTIRTAGAAYDADCVVSHTDPRVCRDVLAERRRELERREQAAAT